MIKSEDIPPEVVEAARTTMSAGDWRVVIAAALNAWPGAGMGEAFTDEGDVVQNARILLPLRAEGEKP